MTMKTVNHINNETSTPDDEYNYTVSPNTNRVKFGILLAFQLLSIPCFLHLFYQFNHKQDLHKSHRHHVIVLVLIVSFLFVTIAIPLSQAYMFTSYVYPSTNMFCSLWCWLHYSLNDTNLFLMAFASMERNWLIFHPWLVRSKRGKVLFHYCPLLFCLLYPLLFYFGVLFIYQCEADYDFKLLFCESPCYTKDSNLSNFDLFFNNYLPLLIIPIFCLIIYGRVFLQKRAMKQQAFKWSRDKKMILQLWAISSLYLGMWLPLKLAQSIQKFWNPDFLAQAAVDYMYLFPYLIHLIYPFIVFLTYRRDLRHERHHTNTVTILRLAH